MRAALCLVVVAAAACTTVRKCADKTLFVTVAIDAAARSADQLGVDVDIANGPPVHRDVAYGGAATGTLQVEFPSGYPTGKSVRVDIQARKGGVLIGTGSGAITLSHTCETFAIQITGASVALDLAGVDLTGADLFGAAALDLAGLDLAGVDSATAPGDMSGVDGSPVDAANSIPSDLSIACVAEDCFNGTDDDCDGLTDCADPDCTGGGSPVAACVYDPQTFTAGTTIGSGSCAAANAGYPTETPLFYGFNGGSCGNGSCGCTAGNSLCFSQIIEWTDAACGMGMRTLETFASGCNQVFINAARFYTWPAPYWGGYCGAGTGVADKIAPTWSNSVKFCAHAATGGGCAPGFVCLPTATQHCAMHAGSQVACPPHYAIDTTHYHTGFDDSTRSCDCECRGMTNGACNADAATTLYATLAQCQNNINPVGSDMITGPCQTGTDLSAYGYATFNATPTSNGTCAPPAASQTGVTTFPDERTICCTP